MSIPYHRTSTFSPIYQRGAATLLVALILLVILTLIVLGSANVALFEQKTATNENRQRLVEQGAEYALGLGGEYLKANIANLASAEDNDGWLFAGGTNFHWQRCPTTPTDPNHPCYAEIDSLRRHELFYYTSSGAAVTDSTSTLLDLPVNSLLPSGSGTPQLSTVGGVFSVANLVHVHALLCLLDTTPGTTPSCQNNPATGNRIAVTLVSNVSVSGENAAAQVKESWATFTNFTTQSAIPLVASGSVKGLGNASIVTAPNAGGYGLPGSIWCPNSADVDGFTTTGVGSVQTCHLADYLGSVSPADLQTTCATTKTCTCKNVASDSPDLLSGHVNGVNTESLDILDIDGNHGGQDIQFFPGKTSAGTRLDHQASGGVCPAAFPTCTTDDNLFEWIFGKDVNGGDADGYPVVQVVPAQGSNPAYNVYHPTPAIAANELQVLSDYGAQSISNCDALDSNSRGLYRVTGSCDFSKGDVGAPSHPVVVVVDGNVKISKDINFFGMLFVRDPGTGASLSGAGNPQIFGSVVVEGDVDIQGGLNIIYTDTAAGAPKTKLDPATRFARLPGSWLDSRKSF